MAVSVNWGFFVRGVLVMRALLFGVYAEAPDFWKPCIYELQSTSWRVGPCK